MRGGPTSQGRQTHSSERQTRLRFASWRYGSVCTTTSTTAGTAPRTRASIALARPCASARESARGKPESEKDDDARLGANEPELARFGARLCPHRRLDRSGVDVDLLARRRLADRLEVCPDGPDLGSLREDRGLDLLGDVVCPVEREVARKLQMERDLDVPVHVQHGQVVQLAHVRHGERRGQDTFAKCRVAALGFDVHDDVDPGKCIVQRVLDAVRRGVPLTDGRPRRDADDDVREALSSRAA